MTIDYRISGLPAATESIAGDDLLAVTNVSAPGTGKTEKRTWLEMQNAGWISITDTWTYASATTITVPTGAASIYAIGDQVRLKQGGGYKYFYIVAIADTLLTVTGGSDYSVADVAITDASFSKGGGVGHPGWFNWTPTYSATSGMTFTDVTTDKASFYIDGRLLICQIEAHGTIGGTVSSSCQFSSPVAISHVYYCIGQGNPAGSWGTNIMFVWQSTTLIDAQMADYSNWASGTERYFRGTVICSI